MNNVPQQNTEEFAAYLTAVIQEAIDKGQIAQQQRANIKRLIEKGVIQKIEQMCATPKE